MMRDRYSRRGGPPPEQKPYDFVPIVATGIPRSKPVGHDKLANNMLSGQLQGTIVALSPVHVASGQIELTGRQDPPLVKAHVRVNGVPVIPAMSLKGAVRSIVEAISRSCLRVTRVRDDQQPRGVYACNDKNSLCVACRMFGALGYEGHVRFGDAVQQENRTEILLIPTLFSPRPRERIYKDGMIKGRKFYHHGRLAQGNVPVEVCPKDSHFSLLVDFDNLSPAELGLLLIALGLGTPPLRPKLGGGKPACLGSVEIVPNRLLVRQQGDTFTTYAGSTTEARIEQYLESARQLIVQEQAAKLSDILRYPGTRNCASGTY